MEEIKMIPNPIGGWIMMYPCGASEIRSREDPAWAAFELRTLGKHRYRIACKACGHATEKHTLHEEMGSTSEASS